MADIALSQGVRQNLLSMQKTVDLMGRTQNRLATGKKVNSALDNATSFFVASGLENRANDLSRILDSMGLGIKTLEQADNGIKGLKRLIETAQGVARQALQAAASNGKVTTAKTPPLTLNTDLTADLGYVAGDEITFTDGAGNDVVFNIAANDTIQDLMDDINASANMRATFNGSQLIIEDITGGSLTIEKTANVGVDEGLEPLFGTSASGDGPITFPGTNNAVRASLAQQFESLKEQMDQLIKDTGYNGVNLLNGDILKVLFNETNSTFTNIQGVVFNSVGLGLAQVVGGASTDSTNKWQSDLEISAALVKLDAALNKVRTQASNFGSHLVVLQTRQDFTKTSILTLNAGSDLLVLADTNEEGANLLALQTRQQLSTQALSLASQTDQAVLRLFG